MQMPKKKAFYFPPSHIHLSCLEPQAIIEVNHSLSRAEFINVDVPYGEGRSIVLHILLLAEHKFRPYTSEAPP